MNLKIRKSLLLSRQPNFDDEYEILPVEFVRYVPKFVNNPLVKDIQIYNVTIVAKLNTEGVLLAVAIPHDISVDFDLLSEYRQAAQQTLLDRQVEVEKAREAGVDMMIEDIPLEEQAAAAAAAAEASDAAVVDGTGAFLADELSAAEKLRLATLEGIKFAQDPIQFVEDHWLSPIYQPYPKQISWGYDFYNRVSPSGYTGAE